MHTENYHEYKFFLERYRHLVFAFIAEDLANYVDEPDINPRTGKYDKTQVARISVNGRLKIPDGPYKEDPEYIFVPGNPDPELRIKKIGPTQYDNFIQIISKTVGVNFKNTIERYASEDCDYKYTRDCATELTYNLKNFWKLK